MTAGCLVVAESKVTDQEKKTTDWASIEIHFRAGVRPLRSIGEEFGVSHVAIKKHADKNGWARDLKQKIDEGVKAAVTKAAVTKSVTTVTKVSEDVVVAANVEIIASAELVQRADVILGLDVNRAMLQEVATLCNPRFTSLLEALADAYDESGPGPSGAWKTDRANEMYRYIISLGGRAKTAKDIAASHTAYINTQRKVLRMEDEANKGETTVDALLAGVLGSGK